MTRLSRLAIALAVVVALAAAGMAAVFVWPTAYRDVPLHSTMNGFLLAAREQRFTGKVEVLTRFGWRELDPDTPPGRQTGLMP